MKSLFLVMVFICIGCGNTQFGNPSKGRKADEDKVPQIAEKEPESLSISGIWKNVPENQTLTKVFVYKNKKLVQQYNQKSLGENNNTIKVSNWEEGDYILISEWLPPSKKSIYREAKISVQNKKVSKVNADDDVKESNEFATNISKNDGATTQTDDFGNASNSSDAQKASQSGNELQPLISQNKVQTNKYLYFGGTAENLDGSYSKELALLYQNIFRDKNLTDTYPNTFLVLDDSSTSILPSELILNGTDVELLQGPEYRSWSKNLIAGLHWFGCKKLSLEESINEATCKEWLSSTRTFKEAEFPRMILPNLSGTYTFEAFLEHITRKENEVTFVIPTYYQEYTRAYDIIRIYSQLVSVSLPKFIFLNYRETITQFDYESCRREITREQPEISPNTQSQLNNFLTLRCVDREGRVILDELLISE